MINKWFNGTVAGIAVDNLASGARLRQFTVQNNASGVLGTSSTAASLTNGFSKPTTTPAGTGNDVAFALSFSEVANYYSLTCFVRDMAPQTRASVAEAVSNFGKVNLPAGNGYGMWLRSAGDSSHIVTAGALDNTGRAFQFNINDPTSTEKGLMYPALWVDQAIFE
jgi:hypothetical protein